MAPLPQASQSTPQDKKTEAPQSAMKNEIQEPQQIPHEQTYSQNY